MNKPTKSFHTNPIIILYYIRWIFILGLIPIIRSIVASSNILLSFLNKGLWIDITIMLLIIISGFFRWFFCTYSYNNRFIMAESGLFFRSQVQLPWAQVSVLKLHQPFYLRPFGGVMLKADTISGSSLKADINLCIFSTESNNILKIYSLVNNGNHIEKTFSPKFNSIFYIAFVSTNNFIGAFYMATFISQSGRLLGQEFSDLIVDSLKDLVYTLSINIPPATAAITYFLLFTWLIGVSFTLMRYYNYKIKAKGNLITVSGGLLSKQTHLINRSKINYLSIRQNIVAYFFRLYSLYISAVGFGKERSDINCIIPSEHQTSFHKNYNYLFPSYFISDITLFPSRGGFARFLLLPFLLCGTIVSAILLGMKKVPSWSNFIAFVGLMLLIPSVALLIIAVIDYLTSGIGHQQGVYTLKYANWFTLYTIVIPTNKIVKTSIQQSPLQKLFKNCELHIYTVSEGKRKHRIRNLNRTLTESLLSNLL